MMKKKLGGKLIVFEGVDHSGKSTAIHDLKNYLENNGEKVITTKQPGDNRLGELGEITHRLCKTADYNINELSNMFSFLLDRSEQVEKIVIPYLNDGYVVISDRWWYSTFAYQLYGKNILSKYKASMKSHYIFLNELASHFVKPNYSFFLDRMQSAIDKEENDPNDIFESADYEFKQRVLRAYRTLLSDGYLTKIQVEENQPTRTLERILAKIERS